MKFAAGLLVLISFLSVGLSDVNYPPQPPSPSPPKPSSTPTTSTTPTEPTSTPPTKPSSTTSPTKPSSTTSPTKPSSTTSPTKPSSTTSPTKPSSTTSPIKPSSTSSTIPSPSPITSTTPSPKPQPPLPEDPSTGTWAVNNTENNSSCLLLQAAIQIQVPYLTVENNTFIAFVNAPTNATSSGQCNENGQVISLKWNGQNNTVIIGFGKNATNNKYFLEKILLNITPDKDSFPFAKDNQSFVYEHIHPEFETTIDKSYKCEKKQQLSVTEKSSNHTGILQISSFQFEAFHNITNRQFTSAEDCSSFDTPDAVPIAVGCALAALVIIVLAAYLIGRRRRQARGYLSM